MTGENRLTEKHYSSKGYYMLCSGVLRCDGKCGDCDELDKLVDRLGEYEDKAEQTVDTEPLVPEVWKQHNVIARRSGYGVCYYQHENCTVNPCGLVTTRYDYCPFCGNPMNGGAK